jgi:uncharacterized protein YjbI with pentapeptide repeats
MTISNDWWDRWWKQDWSWDRLVKKPWYGWYVDTAWAEGEAFEPVPEDERVEGVEYRMATLQDYWRRAMLEAGLSENDFLVLVENEAWVPKSLLDRHDTRIHFTLMHLPPKWQDGTATIKADPENPPEALVALLKNELGREIRETKLRGPDHRMQWDGGVLPDFRLSNLSPQARSEDGKIPTSLTARNAAISGKADFHSAAFSGDADFGRAVFSGETYFNSAAFSGTASFHSAAFSGTANFHSAAFSGGANFRSAAFSGDAYFYSAAFSGGADFRSAIFVGVAIFSGQGNSVKSDAVSARLMPDPVQKGVQKFEQPEAIMWTARRSLPEADFANAVFLDAAHFDNRDFHSQSSFAGAIFMREAAFHSSDLHRGIHFRDTDFKFALNRAWPPTHVRRESRGGRWVLFKHWVKDSLFVNSRPVVRQTQHVRSFLKARRRLFEAAKRMTEMKGEAPPRWREWKTVFADMLKKREDEFAALPKDQQNAYYAEVEDCLRTLKHKMEDRRDRGQEARFFRLELLARRQRQRDPHVPWWEEGFSYLYQGTSDFGTSFMQPLSVLFLIVIPLFSLLYLFMGAAPTHLPTVNEWGDAIGYSFGRVLPFGPWDDPKVCSMTGRMLAEVAQPDCPAVAGIEALYYRGGTPFWLRFWGSVQSLLALILVFLSGLAIRRRFQIN